MLLWIYDIPTWLLGVLIVGAFTLLSLAGLVATRGLVRRIMGPPPGHNAGVDSYIQAALLLYGLIAGLLAVATWEQYARVDDKVSQEASSLAALYRDARSYPEPSGSKLTSELRQYTRYVIDIAWPLQRKGIIPTKGGEHLDAVENSLYSYAPKTEGQKIVDSATINEFNHYVELRRSRLQEVNAGLPAAMWAVILIGAVVTIVLTYFLALERWGTHVVMTSFAAVIVSLPIFMIAVVDHPFRGKVSVGPNAFELVYQQLMVMPHVTR